MSWPLSVLVGAITSFVGATIASFLAGLAVDWYHIPSREGAAGFFVLGFVLLGLVAGLAIGIVTSRVVAGRPEPGFFKALGLSQLTLASLVMVAGGAARLLGDVGPTIDGKNLLLNVEFRWPEGAALPADTSSGWFLRLSSISGAVVRTSEAGPLWREDARMEAGRWIVPGAVDLFTSRGTRLISVEPDGVLPTGYEVPVPAWPGRSKLAWSEWLPQPREGAPPLPGGITYRWRLVQEDQPVRVQRFGLFEISTIARSVDELRFTGQPHTWTADADFAIRYRGLPVMLQGLAPTGDTTASYDRVQAVALLPGADTALLVMVNGNRRSGDLWLVAARGDGVRTEPLAGGVTWSSIPPITNDLEVYRRGSGRLPEGHIELTGFAAPGLYLLPDAVLDTRSRTVQPFRTEAIYNLIDRLPPVGLSPDERSFVRVGYQPDSTEAWVLEVFDRAHGARYRLPLDRYRMRIGRVDDIDPSTVERFFEWSRGPDGSDRLAPRVRPVPPPYRGVMTSDEPDYREYRVYLATDSLRTAMIDWLVREFQAERVPTDSGAYAEEVKIGGEKVYVAWDRSDEHLGVWVDRGADTRLVTRVAEGWNAALASGKFDRWFAHEPPAPAP